MTGDDKLYSIVANLEATKKKSYNSCYNPKFATRCLGRKCKKVDTL